MRPYLFILSTESTIEIEGVRQSYLSLAIPFDWLSEFNDVKQIVVPSTGLGNRQSTWVYLTVIHGSRNHHRPAVRAFLVLFDVSLEDDFFGKARVLFALVANDLLVFLFSHLYLL